MTTPQLTEKLISHFETTVATQLPTHFTNLNLSQEQMVAISSGWKEAFHQNISLISLLGNKEHRSISDKIKGYRLNVFVDDYEYIKKGMIALTQNMGILVSH